MTLLHVPFQGASIDAALEGTRSVNGVIHGIATLLGAVTSIASPRIKIPGKMPPKSYQSLGVGQSGNGWNTEISVTESHYAFYDPESGRWAINLGNGNTGGLFKTVEGGTKDQDDNFKVRLITQFPINLSRGLFGHSNSGGNSDVNQIAMFFNSNGDVSARFELANGTSGASAVVKNLAVDTDHFLELVHDQAANTLTLNQWDTSPGGILDAWSSPSNTGSVSLAVSNGLFTVDKAGFREWFSGFRSLFFNVEEIYADSCLFNGYSTAAITQVLPLISLDGTITRTNASVVIVQNGSETPEPLSTALVKLSWSIDGGAFTSPPVTFAAYTAGAALTPNTSVQFRLHYQNDDIANHLEVFNFVAGDFVGDLADFPELGEVAAGVVFDGGAKTGTRVDADPPDVLAGSGNYGDPGSPLVPSYTPDFPEAVNVRIIDTVNNLPGRWTKADKAKYQINQKFGIDGVSEIGELQTGGIAAVAQIIEGEVTAGILEGEIV